MIEVKDLPWWKLAALEKALQRAEIALRITRATKVLTYLNQLGVVVFPAFQPRLARALPCLDTILAYLLKRVVRGLGMTPGMP